jgi:hypothetical protein
MDMMASARLISVNVAAKARNYHSISNLAILDRENLLEFPKTNPDEMVI